MKKLLAVTLMVALATLLLAGCFAMAPAETPTPAGTAGEAAGADAAAGGVAEDPVIGGSGLFNWFQIALAVYMLYAVITGRGRLYENKYTKCDYKKYKLIMRILCGVSGVMLLLSSVLELTGVTQPGTALGWVMWGLGFASIVAVAVYNVVMTDRKAAAAAAKYGTPQAPKDPLRAAFVFDDEEEPAAPAAAAEPEPEPETQDQPTPEEGGQQ